jgi:hypothetical protein
VFLVSIVVDEYIQTQLLVAIRPCNHKECRVALWIVTLCCIFDTVLAHWFRQSMILHFIFGVLFKESNRHLYIFPTCSEHRNSWDWVKQQQHPYCLVSQSKDNNGLVYASIYDNNIIKGHKHLSGTSLWLILILQYFSWY